MAKIQTTAQLTNPGAPHDQPHKIADSYGDIHEAVFPDGRSSLAAVIDSSTPHA